MLRKDMPRKKRQAKKGGDFDKIDNKLKRKKQAKKIRPNNIDDWLDDDFDISRFDIA